MRRVKVSIIFVVSEFKKCCDRLKTLKFNLAGYFQKYMLRYKAGNTSNSIIKTITSTWSEQGGTLRIPVSATGTQLESMAGLVQGSAKAIECVGSSTALVAPHFQPERVL